MKLLLIKKGIKEIFGLKPWDEMTDKEKVECFYRLLPVIMLTLLITMFYSFWLDVWESILDAIRK